jgi:hypothetical protein
MLVFSLPPFNHCSSNLESENALTGAALGRYRTQLDAIFLTVRSHEFFTTAMRGGGRSPLFDLRFHAVLKATPYSNIKVTHFRLTFHLP